MVALQVQAAELLLVVWSFSTNKCMQTFGKKHCVYSTASNQMGIMANLFRGEQEHIHPSQRCVAKVVASRLQEARQIRTRVATVAILSMVPRVCANDVSPSALPSLWRETLACPWPIYRFSCFALMEDQRHVQLHFELEL